MLVTFAFSATEFVKDVGSYAGFAAVVALALFALLLFAQAREIKRLRDWGGQAHDRIGELERSVAAALDMARRASRAQAQPAPVTGPSPTQQARGPVARRAVGPAPAAAAAATGAGAATRVASTSAPVRPQLLPSAPVGVGGPALASATMLIPLPGQPAGGGAPPAPIRPATPAARPAVAAGAVAGAAAGAGAALDEREQLAPAAANGHHDDPSTEFPAPRRATPAAARPAAGGPPRRPAGPPAGARPRPGGRPQPAAASRGAARGAQPPEEERPHGRRRLMAALLVVLALVAVGGGLYAAGVIGGGDDADRQTAVVRPESRTRRNTARRTSTQRAQTPAVNPADVRVTVLNGTGVTGLASRVLGELTAAGYPEGAAADAGDSARTVTVVEYRNGREAYARAVARTLGLSDDAIDAIQPSSETACAAPTGSCTADVVVTVGADRQ